MFDTGLMIVSLESSMTALGCVMPHVLIKYAHVLICISAGEGSWHFSAFIIKKLKGGLGILPKVF